MQLTLHWDGWPAEVWESSDGGANYIGCRRGANGAPMVVRFGDRAVRGDYALYDFVASDSAEPNPDNGKRGREAWEAHTIPEELFEPGLRFNRLKADRYFSKFLNTLVS
eukprot:SAG31_NODE_970_length_10676_cov_12.566985_2_plen_109_part_00